MPLGQMRHGGVGMQGWRVDQDQVVVVALLAAIDAAGEHARLAVDGGHRQHLAVVVGDDAVDVIDHQAEVGVLLAQHQHAAQVLGAGLDTVRLLAGRDAQEAGEVDDRHRLAAQVHATAAVRVGEH